MMSQFAQDIIAKGKPQWLQEGEATLLLRQLRSRFGTMPNWVNEKVAKADLPSLENWGLRIFDAQSLDEVFSDKA